MATDKQWREHWERIRNEFMGVYYFRGKDCDWATLDRKHPPPAPFSDAATPVTTAADVYGMIEEEYSCLEDWEGNAKRAMAQFTRLRNRVMKAIGGPPPSNDALTAERCVEICDEYAAEINDKIVAWRNGKLEACRILRTRIQAELDAASL